MPLAMLRAEAPRFVRRMAAAAARGVAAIVLLLIAIVYALAAAHAALSAEIGSAWASLVLAGALATVALLLLQIARHGVTAARSDFGQAARYDFDDIRRRSLAFVRSAGRIAGLRYLPFALRAVRAAPWRLAIGVAVLAGGVWLLWPHLRGEWRREPAPAREPGPPGP